MKNVRNIFIIVLCIVCLSASAQCTMTCRNNLNISLSANCNDSIKYDMIMSDPYNTTTCSPNSPSNFEVIIMYNNLIIPSSPRVTGNEVGKILTIKVKHIPSGNSCWSSVRINDVLAPKISYCPTDTSVLCNSSLDTSVLGKPIASDCSNFTITYIDSFFNVASCSNLKLDFNRKFSLKDSRGNCSYCTQRIKVVSANLNNVVFPPNLDNNPIPSLNCTNANTNPTNTDFPKLNGIVLTNGGTCNLTVSYTDVQYNLCGGSYKIQRSWMVLDRCNGSMKMQDQTILVQDKTAPVITCPANITLSTSGTQCLGKGTLPKATATDNCSTVAISVFGNNQSFTNGGYADNLPLGNYIFTYRAVDACGNASTCNINVSVVDKTSPTVICDQSTVTVLNNTGTALVYTNTIDDGSYDNCCSKWELDFKLKRMGQSDSSYNNFVTFDCADVGQVRQVIMRVKDCYDNANFCMVNVIVQDKSGPSIFCPSNKTVNCYDDVLNMSKYGTATGSDNCSFTITNDTTININQCRVGTILRKFTATDNGGRTAVCTQTINVINADPFYIADIKWPDNYNYTATNCTSPLNLDTASLPAKYKPSWNNYKCAIVGVKYSDQLFTGSGGACYSILRKWEIIDWCQYDPNATPKRGYWSYTQTLNVTDNTPPILTTFNDTTILSLQNTCGSDFVQLPIVTATDCSKQVNISNSSNNNGANASGIYPYGTTNITFMANDGCGNMTTKIVKVTVKDGLSPNLVCKDLSSDITPVMKMTNIAAKLFIASLSDNCTPKDSIRITYENNDTIRSYTCDSLGMRAVLIVATDKSGNKSTCKVKIDIQDNMRACNPPVALMGNIVNEMGENVELVDVNLLTTFYKKPITTTATGQFYWDSLPTGLSYKILPIKDNDALNGVTTLDIVEINKHILGVKPLDSPYKMLAADVNRSGSITSLDMLDIRKLILRKTTSFGNNTSWRFIMKSDTFVDPNTPFTTNLHESWTIDTLKTTKSCDFIALKVGDVNLTSNPNSLLGSTVRNNLVKLVNLEASDWKAHEQNTLVLSLEDEVLMDGFQMAIRFDDYKLQYIGTDITSDVSSEYVYYDKKNSTINISYLQSAQNNNNPTIKLNFIPKNNLNPTNLFSIDNLVLPSELYQNDKIYDLKLQYKQENTNEFSIISSNNNLQSSIWNLQFYAPKEEIFYMIITDEMGRKIYQNAENALIGNNSIQLNTSKFSNGIYFYSLTNKQITKNGKLIILK